LYYLLKTEPSEYSFADLQKDEETLWDGVTNPAAVKNLREMHAGDKVVIYHTGDERRVAGLGSVVSVDAKDPRTPRVTIRAGKPSARTVDLKEIKASPMFAGSALVRQGRLSVVPLSEEQFRFLTTVG
jgi:predicted RNA-binding protein with PUA-like domain